MTTFWRCLLKTWDALGSGTAEYRLKTSASLMFVHTDGNQPVQASKSRHKIGTRQVSDIVEWHCSEMMLWVKDIQSNIHRF
jgi:hypothetical protein